jgi:3-hydroxyisobutyrate dehydrogenase
VAELARRADVAFLSLPDGKVVARVAAEIAAAPGRRTSLVVDLSTIGIGAARDTAATLDRHGIRYVDAPVSGGVTGAKRASIAVMAAGTAEDVARARPAFQAMAKNVFHVGTKPGQGQAMKLLNNFLSATAMAATSEAVIFGEANGLDMKTMLDVLNVSTGQNTATSDKFVNRILTGTFDAGFAARLMHKDVALYREAVAATGTAEEIGSLVETMWRRVGARVGDGDFTQIYAQLKRERKS